MTDVGDVFTSARNSEAPWGSFDPETYRRNNYAELAVEDRQIIRWVSPFFGEFFADRPQVPSAVDIGSGSNLYPALLMLPWAKHITLTDAPDSELNLGWLRRHLTSREPWGWDAFWEEIALAPGYDRLHDPRGLLAAHHSVEPQDVFALPKARWHLGTMFFVAESITTDPDEFALAVSNFVGALRPGAPFATAFMRESEGYTIAGTEFPAVSVTQDSVGELLESLPVERLTVHATELPDTPLRDGYEGMIVATGVVR